MKLFLDASTPDMLTATVRLVLMAGPFYWSLSLQNGWGIGKDCWTIRMLAKLGIEPEY